jgi:hypothetical protein
METLANDTADLGDVESLSESKLKDNKGSDDDDTIVDDVTVNKENVIPFINDYETPLAPQRSITKKVNVVTKKKVVKYSLQDKKKYWQELIRQMGFLAFARLLRNTALPPVQFQCGKRGFVWSNKNQRN